MGNKDFGCGFWEIALNKWDLSINQHFTNTFVDERSYCNNTL